MPHHKSAAKRVKTNELRRQRNVAARTELRHAVRDLRAMEPTATGAAADFPQRVAEVQTLLDRMAGKGIIHRNKAARLKSRLSRRAPRS